MKRGFSLVFVLIVIALLGGLLAALFSLSAAFTESGERLIKQTQALALAEGGAQKAIHELSYNASYTGETNFSLSPLPGVADITVTAPTPETRLITSQSFYPSKANPPVKAPSPITDTTLYFSPLASRAHTIPNPAEMEVEACPAPKAS